MIAKCTCSVRAAAATGLQDAIWRLTALEDDDDNPFDSPRFPYGETEPDGAHRGQLPYPFNPLHVMQDEIAGEGARAWAWEWEWEEE